MFTLNTEKVKELRKEKGLSQQQLADALYIEQPAYNKMEKGKSQPSVDALFHLANIFDIDAKELLKDAETNAYTYNDSTFNSCAIHSNVEHFHSMPTNMLSQLQTLLQQGLQLLQKLTDSSADKSFPK